MKLTKHFLALTMIATLQTSSAYFAAASDSDGEVVDQIYVNPYKEKPSYLKIGFAKTLESWATDKRDFSSKQAMLEASSLTTVEFSDLKISKDLLGQICCVLNTCIALQKIQFTNCSFEDDCVSFEKFIDSISKIETLKTITFIRQRRKDSLQLFKEAYNSKLETDANLKNKAIDIC